MKRFVKRVAIGSIVMLLILAVTACGSKEKQGVSSGTLPAAGSTATSAVGGGQSQVIRVNGDAAASVVTSTVNGESSQ